MPWCRGALKLPQLEKRYPLLCYSIQTGNLPFRDDFYPSLLSDHPALSPKNCPLRHRRPCPIIQCIHLVSPHAQRRISPTPYFLLQCHTRCITHILRDHRHQRRVIRMTDRDITLTRYNSSGRIRRIGERNAKVHWRVLRPIEEEARDGLEWLGG